MRGPVDVDVAELVGEREDDVARDRHGEVRRTAAVITDDLLEGCPTLHSVARQREVDVDGFGIPTRLLLRLTLAAQLHAHSDLTIRTFDDANLAEAVAKGELRTRSDTELLHNLPPINLLGGCATHDTKAHEQPDKQHSFHDSSFL